MGISLYTAYVWLDSKDLCEFDMVLVGGLIPDWSLNIALCWAYYSRSHHGMIKRIMNSWYDHNQKIPIRPRKRNSIKLEVFTEDIPRAAYVNSDGVTPVSGC